MKTQYIFNIEEPDDSSDPRDTAVGNRRMQLKDEILERLEQLAEEYSGEAGLTITVLET